MADLGPIQALARKCASRRLKLRDAVALLDALYIADALARTGGNKSKAAEIAGIGREHIHRIQKRSEVE